MVWSLEPDILECEDSRPQEASLPTKPVEVMEFQLSYFKSLKMMRLKCCTQYANKYGKLSCGHRTGKGQFSFQSQRKAMPKNVQMTIQLNSFHMLARLCSKPFKPRFSSMWTQNLQMYKLGLEKAEEPGIKLPTSTESQRKEGNSRKTSASWTVWKSLTVWITTNCGKLLKRW